jgi:cholesterol transport system auxiliary component
MRLNPAALALPLLLTACTALQAPTPVPQNTFLLEVQPDGGASSPPPQAQVLAVSEVHARPGYDTRAIVYSERANELKYFAVNRWADTPADMLLPLIEQSLERKGSFRAVVGPHTTATADLRVDSELVQLRHDFGTTPSRVHLALRAQLIDVATRRVLATREFAEIEDAASDDPYAGVLAANRALARLLEALATFCAAQAAQH